MTREGDKQKRDDRKMQGSYEDRKPEPWHLDKKVPIIFVVSLIVQTSTFIWWMSGFSASTNFRLQDHDRRIVSVEGFDKDVDVQLKSVGEQLATLKERSSQELDTLARLEQILRNKH